MEVRFSNLGFNNLSNQITRKRKCEIEKKKREKNSFSFHGIIPYVKSIFGGE